MTALLQTASPPTMAATAAAIDEEVAWARCDSPLGPLVAAATPRGLALVAYEAGRLDALLDTLAVRVSPRVREAPDRLDGIRRQLDEYFAGRRQRFELDVDWSLVRGGFGRRVLDATAAIPHGAVATYREVAATAGNARASRAAGNALGANPLCIVVPCHRVLRSGGGLGGYTTGVDKKSWLLRHEGVES